MTRTDVPGPAVDAAADGTSPRRRRLTPGRVGAAVVILGITAMWAYVLGVRWFGERDIDRLDVIADTGWVASAAAACAPSHAALAGVTPLDPEVPPRERAEEIRTVTAVLVERVHALEALGLPADADDAQVVADWLADWRQHLADRDAYADFLATGSDGPFNGTASVDGETITERMDTFAGAGGAHEQRNDMEECGTPADVR